jgi:hypothetical protein
MKSKGSYGSQIRHAKKVQSCRSNHAKAIDQSLKAPKAKNVDEWLSAPTNQEDEKKGVDGTNVPALAPIIYV